jgi:hypothetical protein
MKLDVNSEIFQNLNGALDEVILVEAEDKWHMRLFNSLTDSYPGVVHGNGLSKVSGSGFFLVVPNSNLTLCFDIEANSKSTGKLHSQGLLSPKGMFGMQ